MTYPHEFLPYGRQLIDDDDVAAVVAALRSGWLTTGPAVERFEARLRERLGARHVVACANGTAALHMAVAAVGLAPGEVAVVPSLTFLATANAARYVGAEVAFADVDPDSGLMGASQLETALERSGRDFPGKKVAVALPVHLNGQVADMACIQAFARPRALKIVTDCSHALGTVVDREGGATGLAGDGRDEDAATFSFHAVKTIAMGEGGAVATNDDRVAAHLARFRNHGMVKAPGEFTERDQAFDGKGEPNPWYYEMPEVGYNYRASDLQCALGHSQLAKLDRFVARRSALAERYDALLAPLAPEVKPISRVAACRPAWHLYVVLIDFERLRVPRPAVMNRMRESGIGTQVHYLPVYRQPYYRRRYGPLTLQGADAYYRRALSLPLHAGMEDADVDRVVDSLRRALGR